MRKLTLVLVLMCFVMGCAGAATQSSSSGSSVQKAKRLPHNFDAVWDATMATVEDVGWPVDVNATNRNAGIIATELFPIGFDEINEYASCPRGMNVQIIKGRMLVQMAISRMSDYESSVGLAVRLDGWDEGAQKMWRSCESGGKIEKMIIEGVERRLAIH
ncbi:MAG: hypothetical protein KAW17_00470 [Candidatus Eisenbacteria sp.]|nr:hypothetical protein [Candidatus Eisenbacteria bacterium]